VFYYSAGLSCEVSWYGLAPLLLVMVKKGTVKKNKKKVKKNIEKY